MGVSLHVLLCGVRQEEKAGEEADGWEHQADLAKHPLGVHGKWYGFCRDSEMKLPR